jgi:hypothetical protein
MRWAGAAIFWDWLLIEHIEFPVIDDGDETGLRREAKSLNYFGITPIGRIELWWICGIAFSDRVCAMKFGGTLKSIGKLGRCANARSGGNVTIALHFLGQA